MSETRNQLTLDNAFGFLDSHVKSDQVFHPALVSNSNGQTMLKAILDELKRSRNFVFSVAFIAPSAIALLKQALLDYRGTGTIITSTYLGFNSPAAFRELLNLDGVDVYVYQDSAAGFHAKGYIFEQESSTTAIVGSSNLTASALLMVASAWLLALWVDGALLHALAGLAGGVVLGIVGLWLTPFEHGPDGMFYSPNRWLALALTALVAARIGYGLWHGAQLWRGDAGHAAWLAQQGSLLAMGGLLLGYYLATSWGIWRRWLRRPV